MNQLDKTACREYNELSRRQLLRGATGAAMLATLAPAWLPQVAFAQDHQSSRDVLVSIFLRGGADGLSLCVPHGDADYYAPGVRPTLAIARPSKSDPNSAIDLNGFFGFAPAMGALTEAYAANHLLVVHAAGSTDPTRSHFDAQRFMELGKAEDISLHTGWLGRHLASVPQAKVGAPLRALSLGSAIPATLVGAEKTLPIPNPASFNIAGSTKYAPDNRALLQKAYQNAPELVQESAQNTLDTLDMLHKINFGGYAPTGGAAYPKSGFGNALKSAAALIKAQVGVEAIHVDIGGWDTHNQEGPVDGHLASVMRDFAGSVGAFHADVFSGAVTNVTLVAVSEFGRNVRENASRGTDHGHGNVMFALGGGIAGGRVLSKWPGLHSDKLYQGQDLQVTTDYRDILAEIVAKRLNNADLGFVFPDYAPVFRGVTR